MHSSQSPAQTGSVSIVPLESRHLREALDLSQALQWPYRAEDWDFAAQLGRGFAAEVDGELLGTALWWPYGPHHASTGMIIVADRAQRRGIGAKLMDALLNDAAGRTIVLNATTEGEPLYRRLGFIPYDNVFQHQAVLAEVPATDPAVPIRTVRPDDRAAIAALDGGAAGMDRTALLDALTAMARTLVVERDGTIVGYGCVRRWGRGFVIGPVIARDAAEARALIAALAEGHAGDFVRIDITESTGLGPWLESIGLPQVGQVVSMARGEVPRPTGDARLFALSNQSLG